MVGDQYADAAVLEVADDALDVVHGDRVDPGEGLIQQNKIRIRGQASRDLGAPALAAGQAHAHAVANVVDVEFLE